MAQSATSRLPDGDPRVTLHGRSPAGHRPTTHRPTDDQLLDGASEVFSQVGFQRATMVALAERAGTTKPTLYAHFEGKEALYQRCVDRAADTLIRFLFAAYASATELSLEDQVRAGMADFFRYVAEHPAHFLLLFGRQATGAAVDARERLIATVRGELARHIRLFTEHRTDGPWGWSADLCASMLIGATVEGCRRSLDAEGADLAEAGEFATRFALAALGHIDPSAAHRLDASVPAR
ncbi:TetR/AcrR family transcriptional regulator [Streptomyces sp. NPDC005438]|uniref:TetR/AcrR family transcriptional regulator n=1 Tax=Streptomyces sp. NPDC005438 TaxID=3156880 RepID=UPI0033A89AF8